MIIENPKDVRARYAERLAHQHQAVWEAWGQTNRRSSPRSWPD